MQQFTSRAWKSFIIIIGFMVLGCVQKVYDKTYEEDPKSPSEVAYLYKNSFLCQIWSIDGKNYSDKMPDSPASEIHMVIEIKTGPHKVAITPPSSRFVKYYGTTKEVSFDAKPGRIYLIEAKTRDKRELSKKQVGTFKQITYDVIWDPLVRDITDAKWSYWGGMDANYRRAAEKMIKEKYGK